MSTKNSIRSKKWRQSQKNNPEYWEKERNRKKKQRKLRTEEQKIHERELARARQKTFREKKKQLEKNESSTFTYSQPSVRESHEISTSIANDFDKPHDFIEFPATNNVQCLHDNSAHSQERCGQPQKDNMILNNTGSEIPAAPFPKATDNTSVKLAGHHDLNAGSNKRDTFFKSLQKDFQEINNFERMKTESLAMNKIIEKFYPITSLAGEYGAQLEKDASAATLYPQDAPNGYVPVLTGADGNCLPRAGSLFAFGNEERHTEIRVRICIELCMSEDYYLADEHLNKGLYKTTENLASVYAWSSDVPVENSKTGDVAKEIFRKYVMQIPKKNEFNGMWSIFALASVLHVTVFSIYPPCRFSDRNHFHRLVMPRENKNPGTVLHIMWTNTAGKVQGSQLFSPNHFVAVLHEIRLNAQSGGKRKSADNSEHRKKKTRPASTKSSLLSPNDLAYIDSDVSDKTETGKNGLLVEKNKSRNRVKSVKDICPEHPTQETIYLCTTCRGRPICYKCPLENHKGHDIEDLEIHIKEVETQYLKTLDINCKKLEMELQPRKGYIRESVDRLHKDIDKRFKHCWRKLMKWKEQCNVNLEKYLQSKLSEMDKELSLQQKKKKQFYEIIDTLTVTQRLSMMAEEQPIYIENKFQVQDIEFSPSIDEMMVEQFGDVTGKTLDNTTQTSTRKVSLRNHAYTVKTDDENSQIVFELPVPCKSLYSILVKDRVHVIDHYNKKVYTITKDGYLVGIHKLPYTVTYIFVSPVDGSLWWVMGACEPSCSEENIFIQNTPIGKIIKFTLTSPVREFCVTSDGNVIINSGSSLRKYTDTGDPITTATIDCGEVKECPTTHEILCKCRNKLTLFDSSLRKQRDILFSGVSLLDKFDWHVSFCSVFVGNGHIVLWNYEKIIAIDQMTGQYIQNVYKCIDYEEIVSADTDHDNKLWILFKENYIKCIQL